jgi:hypothetical protein
MKSSTIPTYSNRQTLQQHIHFLECQPTVNSLNKMGNIRFKLFQSVIASSLIELVILIYFHLGYMFRHKYHHQAFINLNLKHKLSYIEYNAVSIQEDDKKY